MADIINPEFYATTNARLDGLIEACYEAAPTARYLASSASVDTSLFARHTIETILRIRLARVADSKVIEQFTRPIRSRPEVEQVHGRGDAPRSACSSRT